MAASHPTSSPTAQRERAIRPATSDTAAALQLARDVGDPWFRCQALDWVDRFAPDGAAVSSIVHESLRAAHSAADGYLRVAGAAWPVRALVERALPARAIKVVSELLPTGRSILNALNRLDGLFLLYHAIFPLGPAARRGVQEPFVAACIEYGNWRAARTLRDVALLLAADDPAAVDPLLARTPESSYRRQTLRRLAAGEVLTPRPFFWTAGR